MRIDELLSRFTEDKIKTASLAELRMNYQLIVFDNEKLDASLINIFISALENITSSEQRQVILKRIQLLINRFSKQKQILLTAYYQACQIGDADTVSLLIQNGLNPIEVHKQNPHPLFFAISNDKINIVKLLLDNGVDINQEKDGKNALIIAVRDSDEKTLKFLIENGLNVNMVDQNKASGLFTAIGKNDLNKAEILLKANADTELLDKDNETALAFICINSEYDSEYDKAAELLLKYNADMFTIIGSDINTSFSLAAEFGRINILKQMLAIIKKSLEDSKDKQNYDEYINEVKEELILALCGSIVGGEMEAFKLLYNFDRSFIGDVNYGYKTLLFASMISHPDEDKNFKKDILEMLIADIENIAPLKLTTILQYHQDPYHTVLHTALLQGLEQKVNERKIQEYKILQLLLTHDKYGIKVNTTDKSNTTPLMLAARYNKKFFIQKLIALGDNLNTQETTDSKTALIFSIEEGCVESAEELLKYDEIDIHLTTKSGYNALYLACVKDLPSVIAKLIEKNANIFDTLKIALANLNYKVLNILISNHLNKLSEENIQYILLALFKKRSEATESIRKILNLLDRNQRESYLCNILNDSRQNDTIKDKLRTFAREFSLKKLTDELNGKVTHSIPNALPTDKTVMTPHSFFKEKNMTKFDMEQLNKKEEYKVTESPQKKENKKMNFGDGALTTDDEAVKVVADKLENLRWYIPADVHAKCPEAGLDKRPTITLGNAKGVYYTIKKIPPVGDVKIKLGDKEYECRVDHYLKLPKKLIIKEDNKKIVNSEGANKRFYAVEIPEDNQNGTLWILFDYSNAIHQTSDLKSVETSMKNKLYVIQLPSRHNNNNNNNNNNNFR